MIIRWIDSMDAWRDVKKWIADEGYKIWQTQYGWDLPEGYIVSYAAADGRRLKIITHSREVAEDIISSNVDDDRA